MTDTRIAFFDARPYDCKFFSLANKQYHFPLKFFTSHLNADTAVMAKGFVPEERDWTLLLIIYSTSHTTFARCQ